MEHIVPFGGEMQVVTEVFGEPNCSVGADILIRNAPRRFRGKEDNLPLCPELMRECEHGCEPEGGVVGAGCLSSLVGSMVCGVEIGARR